MDDSFTLIIPREIDAPVARVWNAWLDAEKLSKWWGPVGFRSTIKELEVRQGGRFDIIMHAQMAQIIRTCMFSIML